MASQVTLKALGLNYSPNNLALPEGSLLVANDVIVRRDNVVESRRGYKDYSEGLQTSTPIKQLVEYKERILAHYSNKLGFDSLEKNLDGQNIFYTFDGLYNETDPGLRIKSIIANKNLYFTTSEGIKKISAKTAEDFTANKIYNLVAVGVTASDGTIYENPTTNAQYTVLEPVSSSNSIKLTGTVDLPNTATLNKVSGAGDLTISYSQYNITYSIVQSAGAVKALDLTANLDIEQGQLTGFLPVDSAVAYRVLWGYKDANENIIYGTPSERTLVYNYLSDIIPLDFNTLLNSIDNLNQAGSMINDGNYYQTYKLAITNSGELFKTNVLGLAEKLDKDILYADLDTTPANAPLTIDSLQVNIGSVGQINFPLSQDPTTYFQEDDYIEIEGFNSEPVTTAISLTNVGGTQTLEENPVTITTNPNSLVNNREVNITGTTTLQSINGTYTVTVNEHTITNTSGGGQIPAVTVESGDNSQRTLISSNSGVESSTLAIIAGSGTTNTITNITNVIRTGSISTYGPSAPYFYLVSVNTTNLQNGDIVQLTGVTADPSGSIANNTSYSISGVNLLLPNTFLITSATTTSSTYSDPSINVITPIAEFTLSSNHTLDSGEYLEISGSNFTYGGALTSINATNVSTTFSTSGTNTFQINYTNLLNSNPSPTYGSINECLRLSGGTALTNNELVKIVGVTSTPSLYTSSTIDNSIELYVRDKSGDNFYLSYTNGGDRIRVQNATTSGSAKAYNAIEITLDTTHNFDNKKFVKISGSTSNPSINDTWKAYFVSAAKIKILPEFALTTTATGGTVTECIQFRSVGSGLANGDVISIQNPITTLNISNISASTPNTTITTSTNHGLATGNWITISGVTQTGGTTINGVKQVTVTGLNTFTIATASTPTGIVYTGATIEVSAFVSNPTINGQHYVQEVDGDYFYISYSNLPPIDLSIASNATNTPTIFKEMVITTQNDHEFLQQNWITISDSQTTPPIDGTWRVSRVGGTLTTKQFGILPTTSASYVNVSGVDVGSVNRVTIPVFVDSVTVGTGTVRSTVGKNLKQFNGNFQITEVVAPTLTVKGYIRFLLPNNPDTFTPESPDPVKDADAKIYSYDYRKIVNSPDINYAITLNDLEVSAIATSEQLRIIQNNISRIANKLKNENAGVISSSLITKYLENYSITLNGNVKLQITVPEGINQNYFYQVYRTRLFTAEGIQTLGSIGDVPVVPDDEMKLVYESFPGTPIPSVIDVTDVYPEDLAETNEPLYTNPVTGSGILQANDTPPLAKDINVFKNSVFYANTKTKQRLNPFQLIGTSDIGSLNNDKITIGNEDGSITYLFNPGVQQAITISLANSAAQIKTDIQDKYIIVNTPVNSYYLWFKYDGAGTDPAPADKKQIVVNLLTGDNANTVATKINNSMGAEAIDFVSSNTLKINNISSVLAVTTITTSVNHGLLNGDSVVISGVTQDSGTTPINGTFTISSVTPNTFQISTPITPTGINFASGSVSTTKVNVINFDEGICSSPTNNTIGSSLTLAVTQVGDGEDASATPFPKVLLSQIDSRSQAIDLTARSLVRVINKQSNGSVYAYYISNEDSSPGILNLEAKVLTNPEFYVESNGSDIGASFTPDISPEMTNVSSIVAGTGNQYLFNTSSNHNLINGEKIIISGSNCTPNIDGVYTVIKNTNTQFYVVGSTPLTVSGTYAGFTKLTNSVVSSNEEKQNRVYYSKSSEPEAVPLLNYFDVGSSDKAILRIFPLRDSLFVFKEDGLYRISGEEIPFVVGLFDSSCIVAAPDSVSVSNNVVYAWTVKGVSNITESGVAEISRPIDTEILKLASSKYTNFKTLTWGVGYDSDNSYTVYTNSESDDEYATIGFRYSDLTNTWTNIKRAQNCGIVLSSNNKLYIAGSEDNIIYEERKNFDRTDYSDSDFNLDVENGDIEDTPGKPVGTRITFQQNIDSISEGDIITQTQIVTHYLYNALLQKLDLDPGVGFNDYYSTLKANNGDSLRNKLLDLATKLDSDPSLSLTNYYFKIQNRSGNILSNSANNPTVITTSTPHNLIDERIVLISGLNNGSNPNLLNKTYPVTVINSTQFSIPVAVNVGGIAGLTYNTAPNCLTYLDLQACYNAIVENLNSDSSTQFKNYKTLTDTSLLEAVIVKVDYKNKYIDLNLPLSWTDGEVTIYKSIPCEMVYAPITFGDPLSIKQIYEATLMFDNKAFTQATASFNTDLKPQFLSVDFYGQGNGIFGHYSDPGFGYGFFGGLSNSAPFRTIIPRESQRCRFLTVKFEHSVGREKWALNGITLTGNMGLSSRGYR